MASLEGKIARGVSSEPSRGRPIWRETVSRRRRFRRRDESKNWRGSLFVPLFICKRGNLKAPSSLFAASVEDALNSSCCQCRRLPIALKLHASSVDGRTNHRLEAANITSHQPARRRSTSRINSRRCRRPHYRVKQAAQRRLHPRARVVAVLARPRPMKRVPASVAASPTAPMPIVPPTPPPPPVRRSSKPTWNAARTRLLCFLTFCCSFAM